MERKLRIPPRSFSVGSSMVRTTDCVEEAWGGLRRNIQSYIALSTSRAKGVIPASTPMAEHPTITAV
jgi:hypothetical protein